MYRGADKSLARTGRKQANVSVRIAWISFGAMLYRKKKLDDSKRLDVVEIARDPISTPVLWAYKQPGFQVLCIFKIPVCWHVTLRRSVRCPDVSKHCNVSETPDITQRHNVTCQKFSIFSIPLREPTIYHPRIWHQYVKNIVLRKWPQSICNLRATISFVCQISETNNEGHLKVFVVSKSTHLYGN